MTSREELGYRLESMFDEYIEKIQNNQSSRKPRFSAIINSYRTPKKFQKDLKETFIKTRDEINCAIEGSDPQCAEGWSFMSGTKLKKVEEYLSIMIDVLDKNSKVVRKKRKVNPETATKNLKFKGKFKNLQSVDPKEIIGAKHLVCYNVKYKKIGYYYSTEGLGVKGTTIQNFSEDNSFIKNIGRSKLDLSIIKTAGINWILRELDGVKSKTQVATGRINSDTILLKVTK